ncbi:hypothetical protein BKA69DRAFT_1036857 [Paraphysoderma sedebokerense]|nr:hypothetical protein BKA69DRAFT_1036857 [Paraphysoderma sedebokerense]
MSVQTSTANENRIQPLKLYEIQRTILQYCDHEQKFSLSFVDKSSFNYSAKIFMRLTVQNINSNDLAPQFLLYSDIYTNRWYLAVQTYVSMQWRTLRIDKPRQSSPITSLHSISTQDKTTHAYSLSDDTAISTKSIPSHVHQLPNTLDSLRYFLIESFLFGNSLSPLLLKPSKPLTDQSPLTPRQTTKQLMSQFYRNFAIVLDTFMYFIHFSTGRQSVEMMIHFLTGITESLFSLSLNHADTPSIDTSTSTTSSTVSSHSSTHVPNLLERGIEFDSADMNEQRFQILNSAVDELTTLIPIKTVIDLLRIMQQLFEYYSNMMLCREQLLTIRIWKLLVTRTSLPDDEDTSQASPEDSKGWGQVLKRLGTELDVVKLEKLKCSRCAALMEKVFTYWSDRYIHDLEELSALMSMEKNKLEEVLETMGDLDPLEIMRMTEPIN